MDRAEIVKNLSQLKLKWNLVDSKKLQYTFEFSDFENAIAFVNKVAQIATNQNHHPDIEIYFKKVIITIWTHEISGLSEKDFTLSAKIENVI